MELLVQCPVCEDKFHTQVKLGETEGCTVCDEVFMVHETDIVND